MGTIFQCDNQKSGPLDYVNNFKFANNCHVVSTVLRTVCITKYMPLAFTSANGMLTSLSRCEQLEYVHCKLHEALNKYFGPYYWNSKRNCAQPDFPDTCLGRKNRVKLGLTKKRNPKYHTLYFKIHQFILIASIMKVSATILVEQSEGNVKERSSVPCISCTKPFHFEDISTWWNLVYVKELLRARVREV